MRKFELQAPFAASGDQPEAIAQLCNGLRNGDKHQTLLGVTGSGKTFTIANVLAEVNRPALVLSHNKTLAAQLYNEFKSFFPNNAVEYFVSYYDYYQPEAYIPTTDTYIEKDLAINDEIERMRLSTTSALLSGRNDVIVVSSVSCLYGIGNPEDFHANTIFIQKEKKLSRNKFLHSLVSALYFRSDLEFKRGTFQVKGDTINIYLAYEELGCRVVFWGDEIEEILTFDPFNNNIISRLDSIYIYPANIFVTTQERQNMAFDKIRFDLADRVAYYKECGRLLEANRLDTRVNNDLEMMLELGFCSGIENYSRYFDNRPPGSRPFCLLDYFPKDFITVIDESHVTIPQIKAMHGGNKSRKENLIEYGFRLPSAMDNRPLRFEEFEEIIGQVIYVSATPADYELEHCEGVVAEQLLRPTGLLDPVIEVHPIENQIDHLLTQVQQTIEKGERVLITTLTKRMAEELSAFLLKANILCQYIHSDVETLDRVEIMENLRAGKIDVLVGVNLLREGLDLPEVSLVAILDADKEGFLRSYRSMTQTAGRAARNINGRVIMYADTITESMQRTIDETNRRRDKQAAYNKKMGITPKQIVKALGNSLTEQVEDPIKIDTSAKVKSAVKDKLKAPATIDYDQITDNLTSREAIEKTIRLLTTQMKKEAREQNFLEAATLRDQIKELERKLGR